MACEKRLQRCALMVPWVGVGDVGWLIIAERYVCTCHIYIYIYYVNSIYIYIHIKAYTYTCLI